MTNQNNNTKKPSPLVDKNTKVTLTLEQLITITTKASEKAVKKVLNEYIEEGLLGNTEVIQLQEQNSLMNDYIEKLKEAEEIKNKLGIVQNPLTLGMNNPTSLNESINNSDKFNRVKNSTQLDNHARKLMANSVMNGEPISTNNMLGGANQHTPIQATMDPPHVQKAIEQKVQQMKEKVPLNKNQEGILEMIMNTQGSVAPLI